MEDLKDPVVQDVKIPCAQPEALKFDTRTEVDKWPVRWQGFEQRILVSVEG